MSSQDGQRWVESYERRGDDAELAQAGALLARALGFSVADVRAGRLHHVARVLVALAREAERPKRRPKLRLVRRK